MDVEGPRAQNLQRLGGEADGSKLGGGQVEDSEQAGIRGVAEGVQEKRSAAGGRVGPENRQEGIEQVLKGGAATPLCESLMQAADGDVEHIESGDPLM